MTSVSLSLAPHPLLEVGMIEARWDEPLGTLSTSEALLQLLTVDDTNAPMTTSDDVRRVVRDLLRLGGFKPTGRNKPASEYLIKAASGGFLAPINLAVDLCNIVSLHSGLPISVVDRAKLVEACHIGVAPDTSRFVFNASGHEIDISGLLCLSDGEGPCANAVKDSQRTKTSPQTHHVLYLVWGTSALPGRTKATMSWLTDLLAASRAHVQSTILTA
jgi:DNA/RNA-binding domain of Phe-tRNA-synthetase-like protein